MKLLEAEIMKGNYSYNIGTSIISLANLSVGKRLADLQAVKVLIELELERLTPKPKVKKASPSRARKPSNTFMKMQNPSPALAEIIGSKPKPRTQVVTEVWNYISKHNLQNPKNRRNVMCDTKLQKLFGKEEVTMFELAGFIAKHLTEVK